MSRQFAKEKDHVEGFTPKMRVFKFVGLDGPFNISFFDMMWIGLLLKV